MTEHTFRLLKQVLGWTAPQIRTPQQGERWTWLILAVHAQLRLARNLTDDLRRRWERRIDKIRGKGPKHYTLISSSAGRTKGPG